MTIHNEVLNIINLCSNSCEPSLTEQKAIPKHPKSNSFAEHTTACAFVFIVGFTMKYVQ